MWESSSLFVCFDRMAGVLGVVRLPLCTQEEWKALHGGEHARYFTRLTTEEDLHTLSLLLLTAGEEDGHGGRVSLLLGGEQKLLVFDKKDAGWAQAKRMVTFGAYPTGGTLHEMLGYVVARAQHAMAQLSLAQLDAPEAMLQSLLYVILDQLMPEPWSVYCEYPCSRDEKKPTNRQGRVDFFMTGEGVSAIIELKYCRPGELLHALPDDANELARLRAASDAALLKEPLVPVERRTNSRAAGHTVASWYLAEGKKQASNAFFPLDVDYRFALVAVGCRLMLSENPRRPKTRPHLTLLADGRYKFSVLPAAAAVPAAVAAASATPMVADE